MIVPKFQIGNKVSHINKPYIVAGIYVVSGDNGLYVKYTIRESIFDSKGLAVKENQIRLIK